MPVDAGYWSRLRNAAATGEIGELDRAFARFLHEQSPLAQSDALTLAALASQRLGSGHSHLDLAGVGDDIAASPLLASLFDAQNLAAWRIALADSGFVADAANDDGASPLLLDGERLYLRRYWRHERGIADAIAARLVVTRELPATFADELARLFPPMTGRIDWQKIACAIAARHPFSIITGGPGTGKTTTVLKLLALLQTMQLREDPTRPFRIRLAAPTGKAAARLNQSIRDRVGALDVDDVVRAAISADVATLHRLLGSRPDTRRFRHHRGNPLRLDVLVIDEASMVDLEMMSAVFDALPAQARLVLIGDKDQLSSVEAGAVLGSLCARADGGHYTDATAAWLRQVGAGDVSAWADGDTRPLDQAITMLRESHRFGSDSGIAALATAVNQGEVDTVLAALQAREADLHWPQDGVLADAVALAIDGHRGYPGYAALVERARAGAGDASVAAWTRGMVAALTGFQLLCALREGTSGISGANDAIVAALRARRLVDPHGDWYPGRIVIVTRNDYSLGLMNGDVGITLPIAGDDGMTRLRVAFPSADADDAAPRVFAPARLASVETAFAMTVHKSQGSEFDHVALLLPERASPSLTRELLYTAVTRARGCFSIIGRAERIVEAVEKPTRRASGFDRSPGNRR